MLPPRFCACNSPAGSSAAKAAIRAKRWIAPKRKLADMRGFLLGIAQRNGYRLVAPGMTWVVQPGGWQPVASDHISRAWDKQTLERGRTSWAPGGPNGPIPLLLEPQPQW